MTLLKNYTTFGVSPWVRFLYFRRFVREYLLHRQGLKIIVLEPRYTFGFFARLTWELGQFSRVLPGARVILRLARSVLNGLAMLEFVSTEPDDGNLLVICRK